MAKRNKPLFGGFDRLQSFPLDSSSVFDTWSALQEYLTKPISYEGQLVVCLDKTEGYGAYIVKHNSENNSNFVERLVESTEFADAISRLMAAYDVLDTKLAALRDGTVASIQEDVNHLNSWLDSITDDEGNNLLASKVELEEAKADFESKVDNFFGHSLIEIQEIRDVADSVVDEVRFVKQWVEDHEGEFAYQLEQHTRDIARIDASIQTINNSLDDIGRQLSSLRTDAGLLAARVSKIETDQARYEQGLTDIANLKEQFKEVERVQRYEFDSIAYIQAPEYTSDMIIKQIEIVITRTGAGLQDGDYSDNTTLEVQFVSSSNPNSNPEILISSDEIMVSRNIKMIFDMDFEPQWRGCLRFLASNSNGLKGRAYVHYITKEKYVSADIEPAQAEPVIGG